MGVVLGRHWVDCGGRVGQESTGVIETEWVNPKTEESPSLNPINTTLQ